MGPSRRDESHRSRDSTRIAAATKPGPTGFSLYRSSTDTEIRCEVAAPSEPQRPGGDLVKNDARDAIHLTRLLRDGRGHVVAIPSVEQEVSLDLVRARDHARDVGLVG
jgi:hypothetical protein